MTDDTVTRPPARTTAVRRAALTWPLVCLPLLSLAAPSASPTAVRCGRVFDPRSGRLLLDRLVVYDGLGMITSVGRGASPAAPAGRVLDLSAATCLPGLIDVHTHLTSDPGDEGYRGLAISVTRSALKGVRNARLTLRAGFTTVRNLDARAYADVALRDAIRDGDVEGPRMLVSGPALSITGGHGDDNLLPAEFHRQDAGVADGPWAARAKVREVVKYGADVIKVMASGGVLSKGDQPGAAQYTFEELQAVVEESHKLGRRVAAHAHGTQSIKDAIRAGVDSVEHASLIDDEGIDLARRHHTYLVFDIYDDDYIISDGLRVGMLPEALVKEKQVGDAQRVNFRRAYQAGVLMAFGTDAGVYPHGDNAKQFAKMVEWGMTPSDAIRAATSEAAGLLGQADTLGSLEPGHVADVIAVEGDPTSDPQVLERVRFVMKQGAVVRDDLTARRAHREE